jgi:hypothetical protein
MRVLICGGRDYRNIDLVFKVLDEIKDISCIISGGATGADRLAETYAAKRNIKTEIYKADWTKYGPAAGPIRNGLMLQLGRPDLIVAFPGGKGTSDMIRKGVAAGVSVRTIEDNS